MQQESPKPHRPRLITAQSKVYATSEREIYLLEQGQKHLIYQHTPPGSLAHAAVIDDTCYISFQEPRQQQEMLAASCQDGRLLWRTPLEGYLPDVPYIHNDRIYTCSHCAVTVLHRADGQLVWRRRLQAGGCKHPIIHDDTLYVTIQERLPSPDRRKLHRRERPALVAMHIEDGKELWRTPLPETPQFFGTITPVDGLICLGLSHGCIILRTSDGTPLWQFVNPVGPYFHFFTVENGVCYLGGGLSTWPMHRPLAVPPNLESFQQLPYRERLHLHLLMREQQSHHLAILIALRLTDGTCLWQQIFEWEPEPSLNLIDGITTEKRVFLTVPRWQRTQSIITRSTDLLAISSENGLPLWQKHVSDTTCGVPLIANRILYLGADDGHVYTLCCDTGDPLWSIPITV